MAEPPPSASEDAPPALVEGASGPQRRFAYASPGQRIAAYLIDYVILMVGAALAHGLLVVAGVIGSMMTFGLALPFWLPLGGIAFWVLGLAYFVLFHAGQRGATPGMRLLGIRLLTEEGQSVELVQALVRYLISLLSAMIFMLGFLPILFTRRRQAVHDAISGTVVVRERPPRG